MKEITSEELAGFDGKEGRPVYVAFQGRVYDVTQSRLWSTGTHMKRHPSGKELTGEIAAAPHGPEVLDRYPQVGTLKAGRPAGVESSSFMASDPSSEIPDGEATPPPHGRPLPDRPPDGSLALPSSSLSFFKIRSSSV